MCIRDRYWYFYANSHKLSKLEIYMQLYQRQIENMLISWYLRALFQWKIPRVDSSAKYAYRCRICLLEIILLILGLKLWKIPKGKCDSYTRMLQMNPPQITCPNNYNIVCNKLWIIYREFTLKTLTSLFISFSYLHSPFYIFEAGISSFVRKGF